MSESNKTEQQGTPVPPPKTTTPPPAQKSHTFCCTNCGASLTYKPGTTHLACDNCTAENEIQKTKDAKIEELDFFKQLETQFDSSNKIEINIIKCDVCGAESTLEPHIVSASCPYCSSPLVISNALVESIIQPKSLLPFNLNEDDSRGEFKKWIHELWFAPNALKESVNKLAPLKGLYLPFWTYDADTLTAFTGKKGVTTGSSKNRKTTWYKMKGTVRRTFDDVLIQATDTLTDTDIENLEPWNLENLTAFEPSFLSGFTTFKYQIGLNDGFRKALGKMEEGIKESIKSEIGGDKQEIIGFKPSYSNVTFKHILIPVYISVYRYKKKVYRLIVNGSTGKITGARPYSAIKIILFTLMLSVLAYFAYELFWYIDGKMAMW